MDIRGILYYRLGQQFSSIHRAICSYAMKAIAWSKGVEWGEKIRCQGIPHIRRAPNAQISIGEYCLILSSDKANQIGIGHVTSICAVTPGSKIRIGKHVGMSGVSISAHRQVAIGDYTQLGADCLITDSDWHSLSTNSEERQTRDGESSPIIIGNNVFIGTRSIILKGVTIGDNAVIGAGSVVTRNIPANTIAAGVPCRVLKQIE